MGARGSDAALEQAEVVLMNDRLENFLLARTLSVRSRRIIYENIVIALGAVVFMTCAASLLPIPLALGVAVHEAWVHAYLHRREGDEGNAGYWYGRAGRSAALGPLESEWEEIVGTLLRSSGLGKQ
jgi:hypothetical protein